jgi:hypothetical protein
MVPLDTNNFVAEHIPIDTPYAQTSVIAMIFIKPLTDGSCTLLC